MGRGGGEGRRRMVKQANGVGKAGDVVRFIGLGRGYAQVWGVVERDG